MNSGVPEAGRGTRYHFLARLASGGMADLFLAEAVAAGGVRKRVALKRIQQRHAADVEFTEMFLTEARLASTLQHPNIVQTYDVLHLRGDYYIVMELLEGCNLHQFRVALADTKAPFMASHVLYIVDRVLSALHYAHERTGPDGVRLDITHRDVSPDNIFLTHSGGVKLLDFGIAKAAQQKSSRSTQSGVIKGKVAYMSPEQCQAGFVDRRTDIYAVGVLMYRMLTGHLPHRGKNPYDTMRAVIQDRTIPPIELLPQLPQNLSDLVVKALQKNPDRRFETAREMQEELSKIIRANQFYVTDMEFTSLVEMVIGERAESIELSIQGDLPADLVFGEESSVQEPQGPSTGLILSTDRASIEKVEGLTILSLRGAINEGFQVEPLIAHLHGDVLLNTEHVARVTSYGVRGLISLFEKCRKNAKFYHIRASVPFLQQVAMVRGLLGGGPVLSFFMPYVDPENGAEFQHLATAEEAKKVWQTRQPPQIPCPGFPNRLAEFDDEPEFYFSFLNKFEPDPPSHLLVGLTLHDGDGKVVEKQITEEGTRIVVRRPLTADLRWSRPLRGVEGRLTVDLEGVPFWDENGVRALADQLRKCAGDLRGVRFLGVPADAYTTLRDLEGIYPLEEPDSIRIASICEGCATPRQVLVSTPDLTKLSLEGVIPDECPRCDGRLIVDGVVPSVKPAAPVQNATVALKVEEVPTRTANAATLIHQPALAPIAVLPIPASSSSRPRQLMAWGLLLLTVVVFGFTLLLVLFAFGIYLK